MSTNEKGGNASKNKKEQYLKIEEQQKIYDAAQKAIVSIPYNIAALLQAWNVLGDNLSLEDIVKIIASDTADEAEILAGGGTLDQTNTEISIPGHGRTNFDLRLHIPEDKIDDESFKGVDIAIEIQGKITTSKDAYYNRLDIYTSRMIVEQAKGQTMKEIYVGLEPVCLFSIIINPPEYMQNCWVTLGDSILDFGGKRPRDNIDRFFFTVNMEKEIKHLLFLGDPEEMKDSTDQKDKVLYLYDSLLGSSAVLEQRREAFKEVIGIELAHKYDKEFKNMEGPRSYIFQEGIEQGREQGIKQGVKQGIKQGIEQGREQGIELGEERCLINNVRSLMLNSPYKTTEAALDILGIKDEEKRRYVIKELEGKVVTD